MTSLIVDTFVQHKMYYGSFSPDKKAYLSILARQRTLSVEEIAKKFKASPATVYRYRKKNITETQKCTKKGNVGRPRKLNQRNLRNLIRGLKCLRRENRNFTSKAVAEFAGISSREASNRTIRRALNREGYRYLQARKKGVLMKNDLQKRLQFAKKIRSCFSPDLWTNDINFYLDGVSFTHKRNPADEARAPKGRIWRKTREGLDFGATAKGSKEGNGGKMTHFLVAISYDQGVIDCEQYENMNGEYFAQYVERKFPLLFQRVKKKHSKLWIQDGVPCQNCAAAKKKFIETGANLLPIPPRSPDLNPIENLFHIVRIKLQNDALTHNITKETYDSFSQRVSDTIQSISVDSINNIISTMNKRIGMIIDRKGQRIKY